MREDDLIRLTHMLAEARSAISFLGDKDVNSLKDDRMCSYAILRAIEIIGEAAYKISNETRETIKEIPWAGIINMRHRVVHAYHDVNITIVWNTVKFSLPSLIQTLERVLKEEGYESKD